MLKIGGKCAVVLPDGQDLFSKTNKTLVAVREYLMRTCDLQDVINIPGGAFENTSIKTCLAVFQKKREYIPVLAKKIYKFDSVCHTNSVRFSVLDVSTKKVNLVAEVPIEKIRENMWSLNVAEYVEQKSEIPLCIGESGAKFEVKTLGEICEFRNGKNITRDKLIPGEYPVIGGGKQPLGYHNEFNVNENTILLSKDGAYAGYVSRYRKRVYVSNHGIYIININEEIINSNYLYYYLKFILQKQIYSLQTGSAQPGVNKKDLLHLKIIIPTFSVQEKIVEYLDFIHEKSIKTSQEKIAELKQANEFRIRNQIQYGKNEVKTLGGICDIDKDLVKHNTYYGMKEGTYKFHTGGENTKLFVEKPDIKELYIIQNRTNGHGKCNIFLDKNFSLAKQTIAYRSRCELTTKYIYYYLFNNITIIEAGFVGANHKNITKEYVSKILILLPDLATQQQIVDYCDANQKIIDLLESEIKANKELSKNYLASALGLQQTDPNEYSASAENLTDSEVSPEIESPAKKQKQ
jgi:type I restriction enzyme S subunit